MGDACQGAAANYAVLLRRGYRRWLGMGSRLADNVDLRHIRDTFGHASLTTTSIYLHAEDDARHAAISGSHRLCWDAAARSSG